MIRPDGTIVWPEGIERPLRDSWQRQRGEARRRSSVDRGPVRTAKRSSYMPDIVSMTLDLSRAEKALFDRFYDEETEGGIHAFLVIDPTTHGWDLATSSGAAFCTHDGLPIVLSRWWWAGFGEQLPSETAYGNRFRVSFQLEVDTW